MGDLRQLGAGLLAASAPGAGLALGRAAWRGAGQMADGAWSPDQAVAVGAAAFGAVVATYLTLTAVPLLGQVWRKRPNPGVARLMPRAWRTVVVMALGVGVSTLGAGTASAQDSPAWGNPEATPPPQLEPPPVDPSPSVDAAAVAPVEFAPPAAEVLSAEVAQTPVPDTGSVVVRRGDSLWRIAARLLPNDATDADITRSWQAIYAANRDVVGQDPGLIFAGQVLTIPAGVTA